MSFDTKASLAIGAFWAVLIFLGAWNTAIPGARRLVPALKAASVAFAIMFLVARGCAAIRPFGSGDDAECERYPGIYGC